MVLPLLIQEGWKLEFYAEGVNEWKISGLINP